MEKNILLLILFSILFSDNCQAGRHKKTDEEGFFSSCLRKLSKVFSCYNKEISDYGEDTGIEKIQILEKQPISKIPIELLYEITVFLNPPNIISLIRSSRQFSCLNSNCFWLYYNKKNGYSTWDVELPGIKASFSYYWFNNNKVRKAAAFGLPRACEFLELQEERIRKDSQIIEDREYVYTSLGYNPLGFSSSVLCSLRSAHNWYLDR